MYVCMNECMYCMYVLRLYLAGWRHDIGQAALRLNLLLLRCYLSVCVCAHVCIWQADDMTTHISQAALWQADVMSARTCCCCCHARELPPRVLRYCLIF